MNFKPFIVILLSIIVSVLLLIFNPVVILLILFGILALLFSIKRPDKGILLILLLTSSFIDESRLPIITIKIGSLHVPDIILFGLLIMSFYKQLSFSRMGVYRTPLDKLYVLFYALILGSAIAGIFLYHQQFNVTFRYLRLMTYYLLFFIVTRLIDNQQQLKSLVKGIFSLALVVSSLMILQVLLGEKLNILPGRIEVLETAGRHFWTTIRVLPPGQTIIYVSLFILFVYLTMIRKHGYFYWICLFVLVQGEILTFNRSYWGSTFLIIMTYYLIANKQIKKDIASSVRSIILILIILFTPIYLVHSGFRAAVSSSVYRLVSIFRPEERYVSLNNRSIENSYVYNSIKENLIFGKGLYSVYRPKIFGPNDDLTYYVHNGYLWLIKDMGIIGLFVFLLLSFRFLYRGFSHWQNIADDFSRAVFLGNTLGFLGILIASWVNPMFNQWFSVTTISIMMGINETILKLESVVKKTNGNSH